MTGALVILAAMIVVGALLYFTDVKYFRHHHAGEPEQREGTATAQESSETPCCGMHLVCEKTAPDLLSDEIVYYDDEELDRFSGRDPGSYSPAECEEFRDVLLTLLPEDVAGWARSITRREIELPPDIKEELLLLLSETRERAVNP
ncbi:MAG: phospholipase [Muribaculaceae bacterium]|nr:phospholipase [Muribaculaceae bacterium]